MSNFLSPIISGEIRPPSSSVDINTGSIKLPQINVGSLNVNDVLTLEFIESIAESEQTGLTPQKDSGQGTILNQATEIQKPTQQQTAQPQDGKVKVTLPDKSTVEIPLKDIKLNATVLKDNGVIQVKISSLQNAEVSFQVQTSPKGDVNITVQNPRPQETQVQAPQNIISNQVQAETKIPLAPLKLESIVKNTAQEVSITPNKLQAVLKELPNVSIEFSKTIEVPIKQVAEQVQIVKENIKALLSSPQSTKDISNGILSALEGLKILPAKTEAYPQTIVFKTPLGNVFPEEAVNIAEGINLQLNVLDIIPNEKLGLKDILEFLQVKDSPHKNVLKQVNITEAEQKEIYKVLQENPVIQSKMPMVESKNFLSNIIGFVKASVKEDVKHWLGRSEVAELQSTPQGQQTLNIAQLAVDSAAKDTGHWRMIEIPVMSGEMVENIKLSIKKQQDETEEESGNKKIKPQEKSTRFVLETNFSRLGKFQFDGLAIEEKRRFDLIIRTEKQLEDDIYSHIMRLYRTTLENLNYAGTIKINLKENFIKPWEDDTTENLGRGIFV